MSTVSNKPLVQIDSAVIYAYPRKMSEQHIEPISVSKFVLAGVGVKILLGIVASTLTYFSNFEPGNFSTPANILAIGIGLAWYGKSVNRPMQAGEIFCFALGTISADFCLSLAWAVAVTMASNLPLTVEGINRAVFGQTDMLSDAGNRAGLIAVVSFSALTTFALTAFFAWLMTRKLPR